MPSITTWTRLEPRPRAEDMAAALEARVHDPLWLLARQWQTGEFRGDDGGSPILVELTGEAAMVTAYRPGPAGDPQAYDVAAAPLEVLVEREAPGEAPPYRWRTDAGVHFLRLLRRAGAAVHGPAYAAEYRLDSPVPDDEAHPPSLRFRAVTAGRVPDGVALRAALGDVAGTGALPAEPPVPDADRPKVLAAARAFVRWYDDRVPAPAEHEAWVAERMEYTFAVSAKSAGADLVLAAPEYAGGSLDWPDFRVETGASLPAAPATVPVAVTAFPAPVTYAGMPAPRLWEFEDARVQFGSVDAGPGDLARMVMVEFASVYGNDWFLVPVDVPVGSVSRIDSLVVTDTFGERTRVRAAADVDALAGRTDWSMYQLSRAPTGSAVATGIEPVLFVPPVLPTTRLESTPVEEIRLMRDEVANLVWAVEGVVQSGAGLAVDRFELFQRQRAAEQRDGGSTAPTGDGPALVYRLATEVPDHWVALLPVETAPGELRLRRASAPHASGPGAPLGRLLTPDRELVLFEEEVPRAGARVTRTRQYARWLDGSTYVWTGRRKRPGRGEGASGLRFDVVEPRG
ncbi:hypothetical protein [Micromonospora costi]|uniref:Uncharacterized protein n=1 Tax=Micromonospora costi TaxID=1530042 RepID=A0A3A9ZXR2_9ACTN|nr:hypothetical protein [Micromonospora costi]RKN52096.1 hypothetical protein D7193_26395 [Micromonospora costi]